MSGFKKAIVGVVATGLMLPTFAFADTSASSLQALLNQLKSLQQQMLALQQQQQTTLTQLVTTLKQGDAGANVTALQQLLAQDPSIYPEGKITGFFGLLTMRAVKRFQKKHGLDQVGHVGPKTLRLLNELLRSMGTSTIGHNGGDGNDNEDNDDNDHPCSVPPGHLTAPGWLKNWGPNGKKGREFPGNKHENCTGTTTPPVVDTTAPVISGVVANSITTSGANIHWLTNEGATSQVEYGTTSSYGATSSLNSSLVTSHDVLLSGLSASTTYHFRVLSKDGSNNLASSSDATFTTGSVDATAPIITGIVAINITTTGATIQWTTNEGATSQVEFGTTSLYGSTTTLDSTLVTSHSVALTSLSASTTYHFRVLSKDASNNLATSGDNTFVTSTPPDTTAPVISGINASAITSSGATIGWNTDEAATGKVYFSVTSPVDLTTAANMSNSSLMTSHSFNLTGLAASTTVFFVVESKDAANNTATSSQNSFATTP